MDGLDGTCWQEDKTQYVRDLARETCCIAATDLGSAQEHKGAARIASAQKISAVEKLAQSDRHIAATIEQWDADIWLLNTPSGVVDLRTGEIHAHQVENYITRITRVALGGECPTWMSFLDRVTRDNKDLINFLQLMAGYSLTGTTKEQVLFFLYGTGGNGKCVFLNTLTSILGEYAAVANMDAFTVSRNDKHPTDLAMLRGARFVTAQETEEGKQWAESRIKALTGGDPITARFMRQDFFTFIPQFKLIIAGNHKPGLRNVDASMRRRLHLIPFTVVIPEGERDNNLQEKLKAEWSGILQWAMEGARLWNETGLIVPKLVSKATAEYMASEDIFEKWFSENCVLDNRATITMFDLFINKTEWCNQQREFIGTQKRFNQNLKSKYPELTDWKCPTSRRAGVRGVRLITKVEKVFDYTIDVDPLS